MLSAPALQASPVLPKPSFYMCHSLQMPIDRVKALPKNTAQKILSMPEFVEAAGEVKAAAAALRQPQPTIPTPGTSAGAPATPPILCSSRGRPCTRVEIVAAEIIAMRLGMDYDLLVTHADTPFPHIRRPGAGTDTNPCTSCCHACPPHNALPYPASSHTTGP